MTNKNGFINKIDDYKLTNIKTNKIEEKEKKLIKTVKNEDAIKTNCLIGFSNSNKNNNILHSNNVKCSNNTKKKNSRSNNSLLGGITRIIKGNQKNTSKSSIKLKNPGFSSYLNILNPLFNRNRPQYTNEESNQSINALFKKDSSTDKYPIGSQQENHIRLLNKIDLEDFNKKPKSIITSKSLIKTKLNNTLNYDLSNKKISHRQKHINKKNIINSLDENKNINFSTVQKIKNRYYLSEIKDKNKLKKNVIGEINNIKNNYKFKSYKNIKNSYISNLAHFSKNKQHSKNIKKVKSLKSSKEKRKTYDLPFSKITNLKQYKHRNSCSVTSPSKKIIEPKIDEESDIINTNKLKFNFLNKKRESQAKSNKKKERKSNYSLNNCPKKNIKRKSKRINTTIIDTKLNKTNLLTILRTNKPNELNETKRIMDIIAMDKIHKTIRKSIFLVDRDQLKQEIKELETNEICEAIEKLPVINMNNNSNDNIIKNNNKNIINEINTNDIENKENCSNKAKYKSCKIYNSYNIDNNIAETKSYYNDINRNFIRKKIVYDSLDDEELEKYEYYFNYISPNSLTVYLIDSIILISTFLELFYVPIYIASKTHFCRNIFDFNEIMLYFIDIFYITDLITEFFRAYYNFDDILITNKKEICIKYLKNWFISDFIEAIPNHIILSILENKCGLYDDKYSNFYNININKIKYNIF